MDWVYSLKIQVFDMLLKLQVLEMCKKKKNVSPSMDLIPRCILLSLPSFFTRHMAHSLTSVFPGLVPWESLLAAHQAKCSFCYQHSQGAQRR